MISDFDTFRVYMKRFHLMNDMVGGKISYSKVENQVVAMDVSLNTAWIIRAFNALLI